MAVPLTLPILEIWLLSSQNSTTEEILAEVGLQQNTQAR